MKLNFICKICNKECKNYISLNAHVQYNHKDYNAQKYYDTFIKTDENEGKCEICGKDTPFYGILKGYSKYCCKSCSHKTEQFRERFRKAVANKTEEEKLEWKLKAQETLRAKSTNGKCITDEEIKNRENKCLIRYKESYPYITEYHNTIAKGICPECKKEFEIDRWTLHNRHRLNLPICMNCYPINYTRQTGQSSLENEIYEFVKDNYKLKISKNNRSVLKNYEIDIWLPDIKLGIECDGKYWHADSRFFDENFEIKQTGQIAKDIWKRDAEKVAVAKENGITILRIKEYDWNTNIETEKQKIIKYIQQEEGLL